jgi:glycosyltransferase involved in cell wall biosynthesis
MLVTSPLVSAIMITGKSPERRPLAIGAIGSFFAQSYEPIELLVINDSGESWCDQVNKMSGSKLLREVMVERQPTLGHLRNIGLDYARGKYVSQWDDDDFSHPDRIVYQLKECMYRGSPVTLESQIRFSFVTGNAYSHRQVPRPGYAVGLPGTVMHLLDDHRRYPEEKLHEDTHFLQKFPHVHIMHNSPIMHIRFHHGANSWNAKHIMGSLHEGRNINRLGPISKRYLAGVLEEHYSWAQSPQDQQ